MSRNNLNEIHSIRKIGHELVFDVEKQASICYCLAALFIWRYIPGLYEP